MNKTKTVNYCIVVKNDSTIDHKNTLVLSSRTEYSVLVSSKVTLNKLINNHKKIYPKMKIILTVNTVKNGMDVLKRFKKQHNHEMISASGMNFNLDKDCSEHNLINAFKKLYK
jgi:hypothetical protein